MMDELNIWVEHDLEMHRRFLEANPATVKCDRPVALHKILLGVEERLASKDEERGETPYDEMEMLSLASGKLKRYRHSLLLGKPGNKSEVTEAMDYLILFSMRDTWGKE